MLTVCWLRVPQCIGFIIPLMDAMYANYYTREVMIILIREFQTPDEEMKKIVLKVVAQCVGTEGVEPDYIRQVCFLCPAWHADVRTQTIC